MRKPTDLEIDLEIEKLRILKPLVPTVSVFGDQHCDAIDAQINVLEERMDLVNTLDLYMGDSQNILSAAESASNWMAGESDDGDPPSESWNDLV